MRLFGYIALAAQLLMLPMVVCAEQIFTAEYAPYELREDAESGVRKKVEYYRKFIPKPTISNDSVLIARQLFILPANWSGRNVKLHIENIASAYDLVVNDQKIFSQEDAITPVDFDLTKYLNQGVNRIDLALRQSHLPQIDQGVAPTRRQYFEGCYFSASPSLYIHDLEVTISPDSTKKRGVLNIEVVLRNDLAQGQSIDVGYDIYTPEGKLLDYSVGSYDVQPNGAATVRFSPTVIGAFDNKWSTSSPKLYRVMVYTRRGGVISEYIPRKVGFLDISYSDNKVYNFSTPLSLTLRTYNAGVTQEQSRIELKALKKEGVNTLSPSYPQPMWFYELCNEMGFWVIEQFNINATKSPANKNIGGTPANDPLLLGEYMLRAKGSYGRVRDAGCVIGYSLGGEESGNGYNMYRLYEWMKGMEPQRPIIYKGARGEWNSDKVE